MRITEPRILKSECNKQILFGRTSHVLLCPLLLLWKSGDIWHSML